RAERRVLVGEDARSRSTQDAALDERVPQEAAALRLDEHVPWQGRRDQEEHAPPRNPQREGPFAGEPEEHGDDDQRPQRAQEVLRHRGEAERGVEERQTAAAAAAVRDREARPRQREPEDEDEVRLDDATAEEHAEVRGHRVQAVGGVDERRRAEADKVQAHRNDGNAERDASHRPWLPGGGGQVTFTTATAGRRRRSSASAFSRYPGSRDSSVTFTLYSGFENSGYEPSSSTGKSASTPFRCSASVPSPPDVNTASWSGLWAATSRAIGSTSSGMTEIRRTSTPSWRSSRQRYAALASAIFPDRISLPMRTIPAVFGMPPRFYHRRSAMLQCPRARRDFPSSLRLGARARRPLRLRSGHEPGDA